MLQAVAALGTGDVWATGLVNVDSAAQPLITHWDGSAWAEVAGPALDTLSNELEAVTARAGGDAWAVGEHDNGLGTDETLIAAGTARPGSGCPPRTRARAPTCCTASP